MSPEVRRAALLAAAKTTLVTAIGCSSAQPSASPTATNQPSAPAPASSPDECARHLDRLATVPREQLAADDPLRERMDVYGEVFADREARASEPTQACCRQELAREGANTPHRWSCCSALPQHENRELSLACTPWGPPCPPALV
ncbi:hypothetical protein [Nannocystis radixulma]|uniref:Secreted protein n=1 Tax=Nannocystis radixulma TaxID=2995305 RepID=A0ABT5BEB5_9BACT|nr:hypothetical protein [Nannocystis radixulma]MDC0672499.1 hypothetical protein [Nannocystis radixulma]